MAGGLASLLRVPMGILMCIQCSAAGFAVINFAVTGFDKISQVCLVFIMQMMYVNARIYITIYHLIFCYSDVKLR